MLSKRTSSMASGSPRVALLWAACFGFLNGCDSSSATDAGDSVADASIDDAFVADDSATFEPDAQGNDAWVVDAFRLGDSGPLDAMLEVDAWTSDAGVAADAGGGFGTISGMCNTVLAELDDVTPSYHTLNFDLANDPFDDPADRSRLTSGAQQILLEGTAGGSSGLSEALAFEFLARCEGAVFVKSETQVEYNPPSSDKTDILISIGGMRVGVSVTRAVAFPEGAPYTTQAATTLIRRKLLSILESSMNVVPADDWVKQILFVMAYSETHAATIRAAWDGLDAATRADTIMYVVISDGMDSNIYFN